MRDIRLLIADHSELFANDTRSYLGHKPGIIVVGFCRSGEETLEFIMKNNPDAVILDLILCGLDGISVLKASSGMRAPPAFIVCTEFFSEVSIRRARQYGASCFLCKPVSQQSLYDAIMESINPFDDSVLREERSLNASVQKIGASTASFLAESGIPLRSIGYQYLCDAVSLTCLNPAALLQLTKVLYPEIARRNASTSARVERDIRVAILYAYKHSNLKINGARPTNREFIQMLTDRANDSHN